MSRHRTGSRFLQSAVAERAKREWTDKGSCAAGGRRLLGQVADDFGFFARLDDDIGAYALVARHERDDVLAGL